MDGILSMLNQNRNYQDSLNTLSSIDVEQALIGSNSLVLDIALVEPRMLLKIGNEFLILKVVLTLGKGQIDEVFLL